MKRLDEIEARANAATEGPWEAEWRFTGWDVVSGKVDDDGLPAFIASEVESEEAEFIAHARTDVPDMAAALRAVLNLHKCRTYPDDGIGEPTACTHCDNEPWPCPTVRAIHQPLGEDV